jgi:hypothetical protein
VACDVDFRGFEHGGYYSLLGVCEGMQIGLVGRFNFSLTPALPPKGRGQMLTPSPTLPRWERELKFPSIGANQFCAAPSYEVNAVVF